MTKITYGPWQDHTPGRSPVSQDTSVEVEFCDGTKLGPVTARLVNWDHAGVWTVIRYRRVLYERDMEHERSAAVLGKCAQT